MVGKVTYRSKAKNLDRPSVLINQSENLHSHVETPPHDGRILAIIDMPIMADVTKRWLIFRTSRRMKEG